MEWYIILDCVDNSYLVKTDYYVLRDKDGVCWKRVLNFTKVAPSNTTIADYLPRNGRIEILHKFISDDPLTYVNNLQFTHPELFI